MVTEKANLISLFEAYLALPIDSLKNFVPSTEGKEEREWGKETERGREEEGEWGGGREGGRERERERERVKEMMRERGRE